jgi:DNA-binding beta-propeller fold protein YncE
MLHGQSGAFVGLAINSSGSMFVSDTATGRVKGFGSGGNLVSQFGSFGTGIGQFGQPSGIAVAANGNIVVNDSGNNRVEIFESGGGYLSEFGGYGRGNGQLNRPTGVAVAPNGNIVVADSGNNRLEAFSSGGGYLFQFGSSGSANGQLNTPSGVAVDASGNIYVADTGNNRVEVFSSAGAYRFWFGIRGSSQGQLNQPSGIAVAANGNIVVADSGNNRVEIFNNGGNYLSEFGGPGSTPDRFNQPSGVAVAPNGNVFVCDPGNQRVEVFTGSGAYQFMFSLAVGDPPAVVTWMPGTLPISIYSGTTATAAAQFISSIALPSAEVTISSALAPFVSVFSASFNALQAGASQQVQIAISVPKNTAPTTFQGTIQITTSAALAAPLNLTLTVQAPSLTFIPTTPALPSPDRIEIVSNSNIQYVTDEIDVYFQPGTSQATIEQVAQSVGGVFLGGIPDLHGYQVQVSAVGFDALSALISTVQAQPSVAFATHHTFAAATVFPNDPGTDQSYGPALINLPAAWGVTTGTQQISIGIMDDIFDFSQPDLVANIAGPTPFSAQNTSTLTDSHGTRVASLVGATANNSLGIAGVMWSAAMYLYSTGSSTSPTVLDTYLQGNAAIRAAKSDGVRVMNGSFATECTYYQYYGLHNQCTSTETLILQENAESWESIIQRVSGIRQAANKPDMLWVFAGGNYDNNVIFSSPAILASRYSNVIAVGAVDSSSKRWVPNIFQGSDYGTAITVSAPGADVISDTWGTGYSADSGTSFAAPFITGVAGLMLSVNPHLDPSTIKSIIQSTARHTGNYDPLGNEILVLDAYAAVQRAQPVSFQFTGVVTYINDPTSAIAGQVGVGNTVSGEFSYPLTGSLINNSNYEFSGPPSGIVIIVNGNSVPLTFTNDFSAGPLDVFVEYNIPIGPGGGPGDFFQVLGQGTSSTWPPGIPVLFSPSFGTALAIGLVDVLQPPTLLTSSALPKVLDLSQTQDVYQPKSFGNSYISSGSTSDGYTIQFKLTSLSRVQ